MANVPDDILSATIDCIGSNKKQIDRFKDVVEANRAFLYFLHQKGVLLDSSHPDYSQLLNLLNDLRMTSEEFLDSCQGQQNKNDLVLDVLQIYVPLPPSE